MAEHWIILESPIMVKPSRKMVSLNVIPKPIIQGLTEWWIVLLPKTLPVYLGSEPGPEDT